MVTGDYVPDRGDVLWVSFEPRVGHEQSGHRPGLVLSPRRYNRMLGLALVCPITSQANGFPFEVAIPEGTRVHGLVLADQIKSIDWHTRSTGYMDTLAPEFVEKVARQLAKLLPLTR